MVFVEGFKYFIEGVLLVFDEFFKWSGLKISIEKSIFYMVGVLADERSRILLDFFFVIGSFFVRYLGLSFMIKFMRR